MGGIKEDETRLISGVSSGRTRGDGHLLKYGKFHLNIRKDSLTVDGQPLEQGAQTVCGVSIPGGN